MRLSIIAFGKLKTPGLKESFAYFEKIIRPWTQIQIQELKPESLPNKSKAAILEAQEKEMARLSQLFESRFSTSKKIYLLDESAPSLSTLKWAAKAQSWRSEGTKDILFCIGSSIGFHQEVDRFAAGKISLGPQTLSHELARVVLAEQLYRAFSVIHNHPYHNQGNPSVSAGKSL